jgi:hypothetical protein
MAEFDDDRALRQGSAWNSENGRRHACQNKLAHEFSSQIAPKPIVFGFSVFSSVSKPLFEQLDLSRIGKVQVQAE